MAKFLPFVVEKSTPLYIYQTLVSRSKGMNVVLVASIFFLVIDKGITTVRKQAAELPEMSLDKLYEVLLNGNSSNRISNVHFQKMQAVGPYIQAHAWKDLPAELAEYELTDIMSFLLVMHFVGKLSDYTPLRLEKLFNGAAEKLETQLKKTKLFSNDGEELLFSSKEEIAAYVHFHAGVMSKKKTVPIKAVFSAEPAKDPRKTQFDPKGASSAGKDEYYIDAYKS